MRKIDRQARTLIIEKGRKKNRHTEKDNDNEREKERERYIESKIKKRDFFEIERETLDSERGKYRNF